MSETTAEQVPMNMSDYNHQYVQNESFIRARLDTQSIIQRLEGFLSGRRSVVVPDPQNPSLFVEKVEQVNDPLCNDRGVNGILQVVEMMINPQTVQGNFPSKSGFYEQYIYFARCEIAAEIITHRISWGIKDESTQMIIDSIMRFVKPFMTRLIDNRERESYGNVQSREVLVRDPKTGMKSIFKGGF